MHHDDWNYHMNDDYHMDEKMYKEYRAYERYQFLLDTEQKTDRLRLTLLAVAIFVAMLVTVFLF
jgi:hypothetical protein